MNQKKFPNILYKITKQNLKEVPGLSTSLCLYLLVLNRQILAKVHIYGDKNISILVNMHDS